VWSAFACAKAMKTEVAPWLAKLGGGNGGWGGTFFGAEPGSWYFRSAAIFSLWKRPFPQALKCPCELSTPLGNFAEISSRLRKKVVLNYIDRDCGRFLV
jgi:hypothetical protein